MDKNEALRRFRNDIKVFESMGEGQSNRASMYAVAADCIEKVLDGDKQPEKTDFHALLELKDFFPKSLGIISGDEEKIIEDVLEIRKRGVLSLRNLRNFVVLFYDRERDATHEDMIRDRDKMSAICAVIDSALFALGAEV